MALTSEYSDWRVTPSLKLVEEEKRMKPDKN
jgi:hypothetical protein